MQFNEAVYEYLNDKQNGRKPLRPNTLEGYMSAIKCHLMPKWSGREMESVSPKTYSASDFASSGVSITAKTGFTISPVMATVIGHLAIVRVDIKNTSAITAMSTASPFNSNILNAVVANNYFVGSTLNNGTAWVRYLIAQNADAESSCSIIGFIE